MHNYSVTRGQGYISPHSKTRLKLAAPVLCTDAGLIELCVTTQRDVLIETIAVRSVFIKLTPLIRVVLEELMVANCSRKLQVFKQLKACYRPLLPH